MSPNVGNIRLVVDCPVCGRTIWAHAKCPTCEERRGPSGTTKSSARLEVIDADPPRDEVDKAIRHKRVK